WRASAHNRRTSIFQNRMTRRMMLTASLSASRVYRRTEDASDWSADIQMRGRVTVLRFRAKIIGTVRILMIAPEPFFEPRGTPFSEFHRIRALTALGHQVDLVTYPFGQSVSMPGLRVFRSLRPPLVRHVKIGPSLAKIPLDALL